MLNFEIFFFCICNDSLFTLFTCIRLIRLYCCLGINMMYIRASYIHYCHLHPLVASYFSLYHNVHCTAMSLLSCVHFSFSTDSLTSSLQLLWGYRTILTARTKTSCVTAQLIDLGQIRTSRLWGFYDAWLWFLESKALLITCSYSLCSEMQSEIEPTPICLFVIAQQNISSALIQPQDGARELTPLQPSALVMGNGRRN